MAGLAFLMGHAPPPAPAEGVTTTPEAFSRAWALADSAQALAAARQPAAALANWQRAYELSSDPTLLLEVARLEREIGHAARATRAYELFLAHGEGRVSEPRRLLAARQLQAAATNTATPTTSSATVTPVALRPRSAASSMLLTLKYPTFLSSAATISCAG
jgi:hypothetical protein